MKKNNNQPNKLFLSIIVILLYFLWPYFLTEIFKILNIEGTISLTLRLILNFCLLGIVIYTYRKDLKKYLKEFKKSNKKMMLSGLKIFIVGLIIYMLANLIINILFSNALKYYDYDSIYAVFVKVPLLSMISTILYYPIIEEIVFKKTFKEFINNKWLFVIITGLINPFFQTALTSFNNPLFIIYIIPNIILSITFSYIYYKNNNIIPGIIYRIIYNLIPTTLAFFAIINL